MNKGQAAFEFLLIVAIVFIILVPSVMFFVGSSQDSTLEREYTQFDNAGQSIVAAAESVFFTGIGSRNTVTVTMPPGLLNASIDDQRGLVFRIEASVGETDLFFLSRVNMTTVGGCGLGGCPVEELITEGARDVRLTAQQGAVLVEPLTS